MDRFIEEYEEALSHFDDPGYFDVSTTYSAVYHRFLDMDLSDRPAIRGQLEGPVSFGFNVRRNTIFCFQCQETAKGTGCTVRGVCGKEEGTANIQDLIIHHCKGIAVIAKHGNALGVDCVEDAGRAITHALFTTITNANFDDAALIDLIKHIQAYKDDLRSIHGGQIPGEPP